MNERFAQAKTVGRDDIPLATFGRLVGRSPAMRDTIARLRSIAARDTSLLLEGESGTGKSLAAETVHAASARRHGPFVVVDCGSLSRPLVEAELVDAFLEADGGTLFLDDLACLDLQSQPRLSHLIERREVRRARTEPARRVNVRIIASTSRDLAREAARGAFRADLYYRLAVSSVRMPALAERPEDVGLLCRLLADELSEGGLHRPFCAEEIERLAARDWPGNVRELRNAVEHLVTLGADPLASDQRRMPVAPVSFHEAKARILADFERHYLSRVMHQHDGNITAAAHASHVDRVHFLRLLDKHGMRPGRAARR